MLSGQSGQLKNGKKKRANIVQIIAPAINKTNYGGNNSTKYVCCHYFSNNARLFLSSFVKNIFQKHQKRHERPFHNYFLQLVLFLV